MGSVDERTERGRLVKKPCGIEYPPREAFATRPPPEMTAEGGDVGEITGLDRPRFVEGIELGIPHTRERSCDSVPSVVAPSPEPEASVEFAACSPARPRWQWLALAAAGVLSSVVVLFGFWLGLAVAL